jgi:hypothetical protein
MLYMAPSVAMEFPAVMAFLSKAPIARINSGSPLTGISDTASSRNGIYPGMMRSESLGKEDLRVRINRLDNAKCRMHDGLSCKLHENENLKNL